MNKEIKVTRTKATVTSEIGLRLGFQEADQDVHDDHDDNNPNNNKNTNSNSSTRQRSLVITEIAPDSLFADSNLQEGMRVLRINTVSTQDMSQDFVESFLNSMEGEVTLVASSPLKDINYPKPDFIEEVLPTMAQAELSNPDFLVEVPMTVEVPMAQAARSNPDFFDNVPMARATPLPFEEEHEPSPTTPLASNPFSSPKDNESILSQAAAIPNPRNVELDEEGQQEHDIPQDDFDLFSEIEYKDQGRDVASVFQDLQQQKQSPVTVAMVRGGDGMPRDNPAPPTSTPSDDRREPLASHGSHHTSRQNNDIVDGGPHAAEDPRLARRKKALTELKWAHKAGVCPNHPHVQTRVKKKCFCSGVVYIPCHACHELDKLQVEKERIEVEKLRRQLPVAPSTTTPPTSTYSGAASPLTANQNQDNGIPSRSREDPEQTYFSHGIKNQQNSLSRSRTGEDPPLSSIDQDYESSRTRAISHQQPSGRKPDNRSRKEPPVGDTIFREDDSQNVSLVEDQPSTRSVWEPHSVRPLSQIGEEGGRNIPLADDQPSTRTMPETRSVRFNLSPTNYHRRSHSTGDIGNYDKEKQEELPPPLTMPDAIIGKHRRQPNNVHESSPSRLTLEFSPRTILTEASPFSSGGGVSRLSQETSCFSIRSDRIYDIFIIHTGCNKQFVAKPLRNRLEEYTRDDTNDDALRPSAGESLLSQSSRNTPLRCFLDADMQNFNGSPHLQMESALETCRYAIVILTPTFLTRKDPCRELKYAFERDEQLFQKYNWRSLYILLYEMSVEDYQAHCKKNPNQKLPCINKHQVLILSSRYSSREDMFHSVKEMILESDRLGAREQWRRFLETRTLHGKLDQIPQAKGLYGENESPNGKQRANGKRSGILGLLKSRP